MQEFASAASLSSVRELGVVLKADGDRIRYRPQDAVSADLLDELRGRKVELLEILRPCGSPVVAPVPGKAEPKKGALIATEILGMPLSAFARAKRVVEVFSKVLDETVIFASDNATVDPSERRVIYRAAELRQLIGLDPEDLRIVHDVKTIFGGTILPS